MALLWAAGIVWLAVDVAEATRSPSDEGNRAGAATLRDATGEPVRSEDIDRLSDALNRM